MRALAVLAVGSGCRHGCRHLGLTVTGVRARVRMRMPAHDEVAALRIPGGVPVLVVTRQTYVGARVVEVAHDIVMPGDRTELDYYIDLT